MIADARVAGAQAFEPLAAPWPAQGTVQAAFAPWNDVEGLIVEGIDAATKQVLVQAYLLTSKRMTQALIRAHRRGVAVRVLMDAKQQGKVPASQALALARPKFRCGWKPNIRTRTTRSSSSTARTATPVLMIGSFNFTWTAAHKNAENLLVLRGDPELAARYSANWERHRRGATP